MSAMASQIPASRLFTQPFAQAQIKGNIKPNKAIALCTIIVKHCKFDGFVQREDYDCPSTDEATTNDMAK